MSTVGQIEKRAQARVVQLFCEQLGYGYLGNWRERANKRNTEDAYLRSFLKEDPGYDVDEMDGMGARPCSAPLSNHRRCPGKFMPSLVT
jgi:hypothetical protein